MEMVGLLLGTEEGALLGANTGAFVGLNVLNTPSSKGAEVLG